MQRYGDRDGDSGIARYAIAADAIVVEFTDGGTYRYDGTRPGLAHVAEMQRLAREGRGLNTYINRFVRGNYAARIA